MVGLWKSLNIVGGKTRYLAELTAGVNAPVQYMPSGIPERTPGLLEAVAL